MANGFFAVLKNISVLMDDASVLGQTALKNTIGVLGDDLAVNAEKMAKFSASRELPVVYAITKWSLVNKVAVIIILMSLFYFAEFIVLPILLLAAGFLAYEGAHSVNDLFFNKKDPSILAQEKLYLTSNDRDPMVAEKKKIKEAVIIDFILSIEIVLLTIRSVLNQPIELQIIIVSGVALIATVGVYLLVAMIIRLDDVGFWLIRKSVKTSKSISPNYKIESNEPAFRSEEKVSVNLFMMAIGNKMVSSMSTVITSLTYIGTIAMLTVAGEIFLHNIDFLHHLVDIENMGIIMGILISISIAFPVGAIIFKTKSLFSNE